VVADAINAENDQPVTLKIVRPELAAVEAFRHRFDRVAELASVLTHPNIGTILDWGDTDLDGEQTVFWVAEALGGGSLRDLLDRGRLLTPSQALVVGLEACRALDAAHRRGLFHTELTPSKMVFGADRRLRVIDFGMARLLGETGWAEPATLPTHVARYASPEQALGVKIDATTDVYALSLVLIEAVTGSVPFAADSTVTTLAARIDKLMPVSADLGSLAAVLERAGRPEAADRWSAAEFGRALVGAAEKLPKPDPIPVLSTGMFDTTQLRRPTDPTGGIERPPDPDASPVAAGVAAGLAAGAVAVAADEVVIPSGPDASPAVDVDDQASADEVGGVAAGPEVSEPEVVGGDAAGPEVSEPEVVGGVDAGGDAAPVDPAPPFAPPSADGPDHSAPVGPHGTVEMPAAAVAATSARLDTTSMPAAVPDAPSATVAATRPTPTTSDVAHAPAELYDDEPDRRRKGPIVLIALLVVAGLVALGFAAWLLLRTKSFEVPDLAGTPESEARNLVAPNDWEIAVERERSDDFPVLDTVIRTDPEPGTMLDEGETIVFVLSDGPEFRTLPEVAELDLATAVERLTGLGLVVVEVPERVFSETVPDGAVVSWRVVGASSLAAGGQILPGETVELIVSKGPEPRPAPDLAGLTLDDATSALAELRLEIARGDDVFSDDVPVGAVVVQSPTVGELVPRGGTVTVQVSKGPDLVALPDLEGLGFAEAQELLLEAGFVIDSILGTTEGTFVEITVNAEPAEDGRYRRGAGVSLIFL
jgi:serine/threonine-protein kinase